jgi:hypothetical protein
MWWRQLLSWTAVTLWDPTQSGALFLSDCIALHDWKKCVRSASCFLFIKLWKGIHSQVDPDARSVFVVFVFASGAETEKRFRGKWLIVAKWLT